MEALNPILNKKCVFFWELDIVWGDKSYMIPLNNSETQKGTPLLDDDDENDDDDDGNANDCETDDIEGDLEEVSPNQFKARSRQSTSSITPGNVRFSNDSSREQSKTFASERAKTSTADRLKKTQCISDRSGIARNDEG